ncbi:MAG: tetratricopeptide repeat protein, partial [Pseudomonadales bacterium]
MAETDEEQIEAIKKWWDENGKSILIGIVLALGGVFGYQAWDNHVRE